MGASTDTIRVLHVDDEPDFPEMAGTFLEREDARFEVVTATGPAEGFDRLREARIDCIVSDYDMPGTNGIEFLETVREEHPDLPFILFTGKGSEEIASDAISAGVTDYLQKGLGTSQYAVLANRIGNAVETYRSARAVEATERKLSELAERSEDILFMFDADWNELLFINSAYEDIWGGSIEELVADPTSFLEYVHPEDQEIAIQSMETIAAGEVDKVEYRVIDAKGETRFVRGEGHPIRDEDGNVARIAGFVRDVTEWREHESKLEAIRERMEFALDATDSYIFAMDLETREATRYGVFERLHGIDPDEVSTPEAFYERCVHPDDRESVETTEREIARGDAQGTVAFEYRTHPDNGPVRLIRSEAYVARGEVGDPNQLIGLAIDATDRTRDE